MAKISVIIPVFNCESTVEDCVNSVLSQSFQDFEIILINDGSTDNSGAVCENLCAQSDKIKYFSQKNVGLANTRNFGISVANSEYVYFVDSDDFIVENALELMIFKAEKTDCDILLCGYYYESYGKYKEILPQGDKIDLVVLKAKRLIDPVWNKLYKLSFLNVCGVNMPSGEILEDTHFNLSLLKAKPNIAILNECIYYYTYNIESITHNYNPQKLSVIKDRTKLLKEVLPDNVEFCDYYYIRSAFSAFADMFLCLSSREIKEKISEEISTEQFKNSADNGNYRGIIPKALIGIAMSGSLKLIYLTSRIYYIFKYKLQR